jgi:hypothetical protein
MNWPPIRLAAALLALVPTFAHCAQLMSPAAANTTAPAIPASVAAGPPTGLADSAALRATVFGTPPQDLAPQPQTVPLSEINIALPYARPVPEVFWFDRKLRVWFSAQPHPAPLAIVISGLVATVTRPNWACCAGHCMGPAITC